MFEIPPYGPSRWKVAQKHFPVLLCTTKLPRSTSQYYFVRQSLHKVRPSTTLYYKACTQRSFFTQQAFIQRRFYTEKLVHAEKLTRSKFLHREACTHRNFYTQRSFYTESFTHSKLLHREVFTQRSFYTQRNFYTQRSFYTPQVFTHRKLLHTASFCTQNLLHTASFYRKKFLDREAFSYIMTTGIAASKLDLCAKANERKSPAQKNEKTCWQITVATLMQRLYYDLRSPASKHNHITRTAGAARNLHAAITLRSAATELQNAIELHGTAPETPPPKPDLGAKAKKIRFWSTF